MVNTEDKKVQPSQPPAFGSNLARFGNLTGHPDLDPSGLYIDRPQGCDPCLYHPRSSKNLCTTGKSKKIDKDPWTYKTELEDWSKNLGYRNQTILERRLWDGSICGPAWHDVPEPKHYEPACKNVGFGRTPRTLPSKNRIPGPPTYQSRTKYKAPYGPHSKRPTFEREEPCRFKDTTKKWSLAPNRYTIIDKDSIEQKSNKVVSLKGPYELFTGKRDDTTIKNHFNQSKKGTALTWPIALKGCLEGYKKSHFGEMNKTNRSMPHRGRAALTDISMAIRKPREPGPGHYEMDPPKRFVQYRHGFNSSYDKPPGYRRLIVWPGVGRYNTVLKRSFPGHGHRHVFLSKLGRTIGAVIPKPMNTF